MPNIIDVSNDACKQDFIIVLQRAIQSANINFLFGSGCSVPAINTLGNIENEVENKLKNGELLEAKILLKNFLLPFYDSLKRIKANTLNDKDIKVIENYVGFIKIISKILFERKNNILNKQATIFTTNYDLYFEFAFKSYAETVILFDGFKKTSSFDKKLIFSVTEYFNTIYNNGTIYNYQVEVPSLNLIKLHGSLDWFIENNQLINSLDYVGTLDSKLKSNNEKDINEFLNAFTLILPQKDKFKETIIDQIYYDQLRIFSNELDKENSLLITHGFSFSDEHIYAIIKRALRNPTLKVIVFCYDEPSKENTRKLFQSNCNVELIYNKKRTIGLSVMNEIISHVLPLY